MGATSWLSYVKHWKASVEEGCDVTYLYCIIMCHAHTSDAAIICCSWMWLRTITTSTISARPSTVWLLFVLTVERTFADIQYSSDNNITNITEAAEDFLLQQNELFYRTGIGPLHKPQKQWNKSIEVCRNYVEKQTGHCCCIVFLYIWGQKLLGQLSYWTAVVLNIKKQIGMPHLRCDHIFQ